MVDLEQSIARLICVGFDGTDIPKYLMHLLQRGIGGVILFARNYESPRQISSLCAELKEKAGRPLLICIDQEGGRVRRLREPFAPIPSMRSLGQTDDPLLIEHVGQLMASELRATNIDMNLAPVMDVDTNPDNPVIADRSFGSSPQLVAKMGSSLILGLQGGPEPVAACAKHFPGHGDTSQDSHKELPKLNHSMQRLQIVELPPFQAAIDAGVAAIMSAHVISQPLDSQNPATMSRRVLHGILREQMKFDGVIISDDLEMDAVAGHFSLEQTLLCGLEAGVDLFLICHTSALQNQAIDIVLAAVKSGRISRHRIEESNHRLDVLFSRYVKPARHDDIQPYLLSPAHQHWVQRILDRTKSPDLLRDPTDYK